jgi:hypothetical protein
MSKMSELSLEIEELLVEGMSPKFIAVTLKCPIEMVYGTIEQFENLELEKQNEMLSYDDAQYYGEV